MKRVCFLIYNLEPGGLQHYLLRLIEFSKGKIDATLIVKNGKGGILLNKFLELNVSVITISVGHLNLVGWWKVYTVFRNGKFQSVCDLTGNFGGLYLFIANRVGIKKRIAKYGLSTNHFKNSFLNVKYNSFVNFLVYRYATDIITNSITACNFFFPYRDISDVRFKVIYNGLNSAPYSTERDFSILNGIGIPPKSFVVGNVGRYDIKKNQRAVLKMAHASIKDKMNIHYIICGFGTEQLETSIKEEKLENFVHVLGYRSDIPIILRNFDVFYFPSLTEGQPNALIEALMSGLPIVASNIQPIRDAIPDILLSQLVDPDDVDTAYHKILDIFNRKYPAEKVEIRNWAIRQFNPEKQFGDFFACL